MQDVYIAYEFMDADLRKVITSGQQLEQLHYEEQPFTEEGIKELI